MQHAIDRATFDRLMLQNLPAVQRFAIRLSGNREAGEEIAQEAVFRAAGSWKTYRGDAKFQTWLFQIVVNAFRDALTRPRPAGDVPEELEDVRSRDPASQLAAGEMSEIVAQLVSRLPARQREVLVLVAFEQMEQMEVATVLGISQQNVRTSLHLARERLKQQLMPYLSANQS